MLTDFQELWLTSRRGTLPKPNEVQTINVAKTCEKLRLAITQSRNGPQRSLDVSLKNQTKELSFRSVSCLCYTTLRVHEFQVNDLLNRSEMLVAQSGGWSTLKLPVKRKSSQSSGYHTKRKRQQSLRHSIESISITDYTQLLEETENFVKWSKSTEMAKTNSGGRTTCIHIREITINEVDTHNECCATDEDEGFGNATSDELTTLLRIMEDKPVPKPKATKRKMKEEMSDCGKRPTIDNVSAKDTPHTAHVENEIEIARSVGAGDNFAVEHFNPAKEIHLSNSTINDSRGDEITEAVTERSISDTDENNDNSFELMNNNSDNMPIVNNNPDKLGSDRNEMSIGCNINQQCCSTNTRKFLKQSRSKSKIIIDERIELTQAEMRTQLQVQVNFRKKLRKMRAKVKWHKPAHEITQSRKRYERILPTANTLLSTLNRSCIAMRKFKLKNHRISLNASAVCSVHRNLLCEILNCKVADDLANEICENCNKDGKNKRRRLSAHRPQTIYTQEEDIYNQIPLVTNNEMTCDFINNNNINLERVVESSQITNDQDECGSFDVMVKLLNLWRTKNVPGDEIYVEYIFKPSTMVRKQAAKAFFALLKLAANGFIILRTTEQSTQLRGIKLGPASTKLIQKSDINCKTLKRRHNGYRIHAN